MRALVKWVFGIGIVIALVVGAVAVTAVLLIREKKDNSHGVDEAKAAGKTPADFPHAENDFFAGMDGPFQLTPEEVRGRNTWLVWTGGNEAFWDWLSNNSFGTFDMLKTISSYPCSEAQREELAKAQRELAEELAEAQPELAEELAEAQRKLAEAQGEELAEAQRTLAEAQRKLAELPFFHLYQRNGRFRYLGLMNEPKFRAASQPDRWGLCLDEPAPDRGPDFDEKVYGRATGVLGLRIYPNPNFDATAQAAWSARKFYTDPSYYSSSSLVRPYRVGMSCAFCHISHHPLYPPSDPENPQFQNLSATIGAQYFWFGRIFSPNLTPKSFVWHLIDSAQPGAVDTSFLPQDHINNPRAMNAIFDLPARLGAAERFHQEKIDGGALDLPEVTKRGATFGVPHILWDGADSVGVDAALTRVYINIGEFHQEWIKRVQLLVGGRPQSPIEVKVAQANSVYWNATQERAGDLARYLIRASGPMRLEQAPGGAEELRRALDAVEYDKALANGKAVFAENCARCHSSKLPQPAPGLDDGPDCSGGRYLECWDRYWEWTKTDDFKAKMREIVLAPDFLQNNYLSTDARIPVTRLKAGDTKQTADDGQTGGLETEICSAMASNAIEGYVWDNFSSQSYKALPAVGDVTLHDPLALKEDDQYFQWSTPGGGRGYQRVPSLISIWATAPFLHNNEIGVFTNDPSVAGRMRAFDDGIRKLLWLKKRDGSVRRTCAPDDPYQPTCAAKLEKTSGAYPSPSPDTYGQPVPSGQTGAAPRQYARPTASAYETAQPASYTGPPPPPAGKYDGWSEVTVKVSSLPEGLQGLFGQGRFARTLRWALGAGSLVEGDDIRIGPIPAGTPVALLANINVDRNHPYFSAWKLVRLLGRTKDRLRRIEHQKLDRPQSTELLKELAPDLRALSTCPDFYDVDRGHNFGRTLEDKDKEALIVFLKTF